MGYNNDPKTSFADIQKVFNLLEESITKRLKEEGSRPPAPPQARPSVTRADIQIAQRARAILDSPSKWSRVRTQTCPDDATRFNLYGALEKADREGTGAFDNTCAAMVEARHLIVETATKSGHLQGPPRGLQLRSHDHISGHSKAAAACGRAPLPAAGKVKAAFCCVESFSPVCGPRRPPFKLNSEPVWKGSSDDRGFRQWLRWADGASCTNRGAARARFRLPWR